MCNYTHRSPANTDRKILQAMMHKHITPLLIEDDRCGSQCAGPDVSARLKKTSAVWLQKASTAGSSCKDGRRSCRNSASVSRGRDSLVDQQLLCILRRDE